MARRSRTLRPARNLRFSLPPVRVLVKRPTFVTSRSTVAIGIPDRRQWSPARWGAPVAATRRTAVRLAVPVSGAKALPARVAFSDPRKVIICHRRKSRREVLFAFGKGGGGKKKPRRSPWSDVSC